MFGGHFRRNEPDCRDEPLRQSRYRLPLASLRTSGAPSHYRVSPKVVTVVTVITPFGANGLRRRFLTRKCHPICHGLRQSLGLGPIIVRVSRIRVIRKLVTST